MMVKHPVKYRENTLGKASNPGQFYSRFRGKHFVIKDPSLWGFFLGRSNL